jgi:hypothetical protein
MAQKFRLPPNCVDVTAKESGKVFVLIGATAAVRALKLDRPERLDDHAMKSPRRDDET